MQRLHFISLYQLVFGMILCSGLLTGFQSLPHNPTTQNPQTSQPLQPVQNATPPLEITTPVPSSVDDQTPTQPDEEQPKSLNKPQPLPPLLANDTDFPASLNSLVTKQTVVMDAYTPLIQEITIGIEQISLAKNIWHMLKKLKNRDIHPPYEWAGNLAILWKGNIQLASKFGYVSLYSPVTISNTHAYRTKGFYAGFGVGYVSRYNSTNNVYAGLHYNRAKFTNATILQNQLTPVSKKELTASWLEMIIGAESRLFKKVALYGACTLNIGWLYQFTPFNQAQTYPIPGYGLNANKFNLGLNLYILYKFSFIEKVITFT